MDFNATIDLIIKDLDEARQIIDDLKKYPGVPALQVELAKSKCKSAGEVIALLKSLRDNIPLVREESIQPLQQSPLPEEKKAPSISVSTNLPSEEKKNESIPVEIGAPPVVKKEESKKIPKKVPESTIIADKFSHLSNRFNEQLGSMKSDDDVSDKLKTKPLTNLSEAIGVNDRFLFIREIFDGNKDAYAQAISRLDNAESLTDARAVIMSYTGDSDENEAIKQLLDLVKRKLPSNE
ncbi:MAG: hypothetical protein NTV31_01275 [Bacteroidia bacterium]|nr:hypothetical protein [Bacteroidia bacterium]